MTENSGGSGIGPLYFIVGGLVVAAGIGVFVYSGGYLGDRGSKTTTEKTTITAPAIAGSTTTTTTTEKTRP
jgi:hypothetical protein